MTEITKSPGRIALEDALEEFGPIVITGDELNITMLQELVKNAQQFQFNDTTYEEFPQSNILRNVLLDLGWQHNGRKRPEGERTNKHTFYIQA